MSNSIILPEFSNTIDDGLCLVAFMKPGPDYDEDEFKKLVKPGSVLATDDDKNLPIYPSMQDFVVDVVESDFNPDIDRTLHFTSEDLPNIIVWKCQPLGDLRDTAHSTIKLAYAILLVNPMNMEQIRSDIRLFAAKYGKMITQEKEEEITDLDATMPTE